MGDVDALAKKMDEAMEKADIYQSSFDRELLPINIAQQYIDFMRTNG